MQLKSGTGRSARWAPAVVVLAALAGTGAFLANANADDPAPSGVGPGRVTPTFSAVEAATPSSALSAATLAKMKEYHGVLVDPVGDAPAPKLDAKDAAISAASQFHFVNDGGRLREVQLARVTTARSGEEVNGKIIPDLAARVVWVVVFDHVASRPHGPKPTTDAERAAALDLASQHKAVVAVLVDPTSGKVLSAFQW